MILTEQQIRDYYTTAGLTPVMCVLGGSQSYAMPNADDHDYFGYHVEEHYDNGTKAGVTTLFSDSTTTLKSIPIIMIAPAIRGDYGAAIAMYTIDNWLYHQLVFGDEPQYSNIRNQIIAAKNDDWMRFYTYTAFRFFRDWKEDPENLKARNIAVRIALTVKWYLNQGTLQCNWTDLTTEYPITTDEDRTTLKEELKPIFLNLIIDRINWEMIR